MTSSDDESETLPQAVSNYHFVDKNDEPISFVDLPIQWSEVESLDGKKNHIFLHGTTDNGLQKIYKQVTAWKFDVLNTKPEISVLTKENNWIKLQKPRKSFENIIRTILITVHCLHFLRKNPEASGKSLWDHLAKVLSLHEIRPSENDLVDHMPLISEAVKRDESLRKSEFLLTFLEEKPKKKALDEVVQNTMMSSFIVDDMEDDIIDENDESDEEDMYDSVCALCDNGGDILCCDGKCMRSFHATKEAGADSDCVSLGYTNDQVKDIQNFFCKNCEHQQHQCFSCGKLGSSDKSSGAEVFSCVSATCSHFYHPHCVAKLLHRDNEALAKELQEKIAAGEPFICPVHKCSVCKGGENKKDPELQFAVCRRCPKSYHRKCLPRKIAFEDSDDDDEDIIRAWDGLLPNRILIYCLKHEIDPDLGTPIRNHIKFPGEEKKKSRASELSLSREKGSFKRKSLAPGDSPREKTATKASKKVEFAKRSSGIDSSRKSKDASRTSLRDNNKKMDRPATDENKTSLGKRLYETMFKSESVKSRNSHDNNVEQILTVEPAMNNLNSSHYQLDSDSERSILDLMSKSSVTLEEVIRKHKNPSTHAYSSKNIVDKTITQGKVEGAVEAVRTAVKRLEAGCSIEDAKAVCEPDVVHHIIRWKNKLKVYLAPFIHGMRYTSFGRHFTKVEKLEEIVDKLHWYVRNGDTIVDFCCGANDFSCLMKRKLEETGKKCSYKNYDIIQPKNDFNFEQRDWMEVRPKELPPGSKLIMGLNPPFGVKAALANKFIDKALEFKPKLVVLIVPPETERLDQKKTPYDLVWEDDVLLSGMSFYLPGSVDVNDVQMDQWNNTPPPLYLWTHKDWSASHMAIAKKQGHLTRHRNDPHFEANLNATTTAQLPDRVPEDPMPIDELPVEKVEPDPLERREREIVVERNNNKASSPIIDKEIESQENQGTNVKNKLGNNSKKRRRGSGSGSAQYSRGVAETPLENGGSRPPRRSPPPNVTETRLPRRSSPLPNVTENRLPHRSSPPPNVTENRLSPRSSPLNVTENRSLLEDRGMARISSPPNRMDAGEDDMERRYGLQYGTGYAGTGSLDDVSRRYSFNEQPYSSATQRWSSSVGPGSGTGIDGGYRAHSSYLADRYAGYPQMSSYTTPPSYTAPPTYRHIESSYATSAMQRYEPRLDELNPTSTMQRYEPRLNDLNPRANPLEPMPRYRAESMGFAPGPHHTFSHQSGNSGWIND